ncbi:MAG: 1-(5-phosphoribosyl)-5-[(5-phosphoribosylamino)methylideneamino]imidazole-4-carboxamide isomerase [Candidatus Omnitrophica bacterium]|nr:1-(5-phosphoribosyl)-5-[(5-phosphoribosylamino)methylideneamino]imidazole-4-carboxamide isomerase [Candidatus Omnitrophota bacterium]
MIIIPAIDLKDGCVVRLFQGKLSEQKIYSRDPVKTARHWAKQGAQLLHVVDLDGATSGVAKNLNLVKEIVKSVDVPVEFGGGARDQETIKQLLSYGIWRVVLGTKAVQDRAFLKRALTAFKDKIIVSVDARDGKVMIKGWQDASGQLKALDFCLELKKMGFGQIIFTDTAKDGALVGPNIKDLKSLIKETSLKVIASGGVSSLEDITKLKSLEKSGVAGVIVGKALYEGKFTLAQALKII